MTLRSAKKQFAFVASLEKGLAALACFAESVEAQTSADVARRLDLPRATVRRLLLTLADLGYLSTDGKWFSVTPRVLQLGYAYFSSQPTLSLIAAELRRITEQTGHTAFSAILDGEDIVITGRAEGQIFESNRGVGARLPAYCTSMGRVLLAALNDEKLRAYLSRVRPQAYTVSTLTKRRDIETAVARVRTQGYCIINGETTLGLSAIAVPIRAADGKPIAAMDIVSLSAGESAATLKSRCLPVLLEAASRLEQALRHNVPQR